MQRAGLMVSGINPRRNLVEIVELKGHPWFLGTQAHPEFQSKPNKAHPLFAAFIAATLKHKKGGAGGSSAPLASKSPKAKAKPATRAKVK
jgi:CTP synthase